ncbi:MAG: hypothetical protein ACT4RN_17800 [Pseudonocardia sp.]
MKARKIMTVADTVEWRATVLTRLATHLAESVRPLLPDEVTLVTTSREVVLLKLTDAGAPRTAVTREIRWSVDPTTIPLETSAWDLFDDIQDVVVEGIHGGWPFNEEGTAIHPWVSRSGDVLNLGFRGRGSNAQEPGIDLPPFPIPPAPTETRVAG